MTLQQWLTYFMKQEQRMIAHRRHLHAHPELSFEEHETAKYIATQYEPYDVTMHTNVGNGYGIVVEIEGELPGPTIALRADFDALPIHERVDVPFRSTRDGVMHACGHDVHTAILLSVAETLIAHRNTLKGTVKVIHQHAEETPPGGAKSIVESGLLDDVKHYFALHVTPAFDVGTIAYTPNLAMAGKSCFELHIQGKGGHSSSPHQTRDAIVAGSYFVTQVQTIVSRHLDPYKMGVVSIGSFDGKGTFNVIQDAVQLQGDVRHIDAETEAVIRQQLHQIVKGVETMFDVTCTFTYREDYPALVNDVALTEETNEMLRRAGDESIHTLCEVPPNAASEDFAYYANHRPSYFFNIGCKPDGVTQPYMHHHPNFEVNERCLRTGARAFLHIIHHFQHR